MNRLTSEKCRELLKERRRQRDNGDISIGGNYTLQALEIALPILEQQERGEGEWIAWMGGECPVDEAVKIDVRFRNGEIDEGLSAGGWVWLCSPGASYERDIIAYRIIPERATNQNGEQ